jgi:hypothetical protein
MDAQEQGRGATPTDAQSDKDAAQVVSAARRRALKAGLITVPMMFTLRSKPVFGANPCATPSLSLSAAQSHGVELPPCEEQTTPAEKSSLGQSGTTDVGGSGRDHVAPTNDNLGKSGNDNLNKPSGR